MGGGPIWGPPSSPVSGPVGAPEQPPLARMAEWKWVRSQEGGALGSGSSRSPGSDSRWCLGPSGAWSLPARDP